MSPQKMIIILASALCISCTDQDIDNQTTSGADDTGDGDTYATTDGTSGSDGVDDTAGGGGVDEESDGESDGGDAPCDMQVRFECNLKIYVEYHHPTDEKAPVVLAPTQAEEELVPVICGAFTEDNSGVAQGGAFDLASPIYACGVKDGPPPADGCISRCESLMPGNFLMDSEIEIGGQVWEGTVNCYGWGETDPWENVALGSCDSSGLPAGHQTITNCAGDDCDFLENSDCVEYFNHGIAVGRGTGNELPVEIDLAWVDDIRNNTGLLWVCDP